MSPILEKAVQPTPDGKDRWRGDGKRWTVEITFRRKREECILII